MAGILFMQSYMIRKLNALALCALLITFISCSKSNDSGSDDSTPDPNAPGDYKPDNNVVAHRGAWKEFNLPDNSIAALQKAMEFSCYASECDIMMTSDKKVIVYHDESIGGLFINTLTYAEIKSKHTLSNGETIPLLEEFLDKVVANKKIQLWLDVKSLSDAAGGNEWASKTAEAAATIVRAKKAQKHISFIAGRKAVLDRCILAAKGDWPSGYMNIDYTPDQFVSNGYNWANFTYNKFYTNSSSNDAVLVANYKEKVLKLTVYTVDDEAAMDWFLGNENIDAITTNYPFKLLQKVRK